MVDRLKLKSIVLDLENNPVVWTPSKLTELVHGNVVVGCLVKNTSRTGDLTPVLNLYYIDDSKVLNKATILTQPVLGNIFKQWLEAIIEDEKSFMFRNPPLDLWLDTKDNWVKKITIKLSTMYTTPYDDCLSTVYDTLVKCYNRGDVYMGNLNYLSTAIHNNIKLDYRYLKNRWHGGHQDAIHLDANVSDFNASADEGVTTLHEIIGGQLDHDPVEQREKDMLSTIMSDLKREFSPREIDQIINHQATLPMTLYRKLLKWRKEHTREDYE